MTDKPEENETPVEDNTKKIAEIKGNIEANTKQIDVYNNQLKEQQDIMKDNTIDEKDLYTKRTELDDTSRLIGAVAKEIEDYKEKCPTPDEENELCGDFDEEAKVKEMESLNEKLNTLKGEVGVLEKKKEEYDKANAKITEINSEVTRLNNLNNELQNQLSALQN